MTQPNFPSGPSLATIKQLFGLSGNRCAFPRCEIALLQGNSIVGEICHIKAAKPNGPRYDAAQTPEERHSFNNLILMCAVHHKIIDDDPKSYTFQRLQRLKEEHIAHGTVPISEADLDAGAKLLIDQAVTSMAQSGGITAHTVHQTFNLHPHPEDSIDDVPRQNAAKRYLAPELQRTIERALYIHGRAIANFICYSADNTIKPNDQKRDFLPYWPTLYPNAPEVRQLPREDIAALVDFYNSLHSLNDHVNDWWEREGQLPVNLFNSFRNDASKSLTLALNCIEIFKLEELFPPPHEAWGTISSRIKQSLRSEEEALKHHIARFEAKAAASKAPSIQQPAFRPTHRR